MLVGVKNFFRELFFEKKSKKEDPDRVSKTKIAAWYGCFLTIMKIYGVLTPELYQALIATATGLLGVGIRDVFKK